MPAVLKKKSGRSVTSTAGDDDDAPIDDEDKPTNSVALSADDDGPIALDVKPKVAAAPSDEQFGEIKPVVELDAAGVALKLQPNSVVTFACFKDMQPGPVIGSFRAEDHGIIKMEQGKNYRLPYFVAEILQDRKWGQIA